MLSKTVNCLLINIIALFLVSCLNIHSAYAENNSFAPGTLILTPNGNVPIEELHSGDRVIGYDFETHQEEIRHVKDIRENSSLSYYLINDKTKITGTHYVYVKTLNNPIIKRVQQLKVVARLFGQNHQDYTIDKIKQIVKIFRVYQLILQEQNSNFFTDQFLVYSGDKIPYNFKENYTYISCEPGTVVHKILSPRSCLKINAQTISGIIVGLSLLIVGSLSIFKVFDWITKK